MENPASSFVLRAPLGQRRNVRATGLVQESLLAYRATKNSLKPDETIDFTCCIGSMNYPVAKLSSISEECLMIQTVSVDGTAHLIFCPVEQVSFFVTLSKR